MRSSEMFSKNSKNIEVKIKESNLNVEGFEYDPNSQTLKLPSLGEKDESMTLVISYDKAEAEDTLIIPGDFDPNSVKVYYGEGASIFSCKKPGGNKQ